MMSISKVITAIFNYLYVTYVNTITYLSFNDIMIDMFNFFTQIQAFVMLIAVALLISSTFEDVTNCDGCEKPLNRL